MSLEKFAHRNRITAELLEKIAASSRAAELFTPHETVNPLVRELIAAQGRLLNAAERVLEHCGGACNKSN